MDVLRHAGRFKLWCLCSTSCEQSRHFLSLLFLASINGPRWLPSFSHQVDIPNYRKEEVLGEVIQANWSLEVWHIIFFRPNQPALRPLAPYTAKPEKQVFFFSLIWADMDWALKKKKKKSKILLLWKQRESLLVVSQQSQSHCPPNLDWTEVYGLELCWRQSEWGWWRVIHILSLLLAYWEVHLSSLGKDIYSS